MKLIPLIAGGLFMAAAAVAGAHTHLVKSLPADGSTVAGSPQKFVLIFAEPTRLTVLSLQKEGEAATKLTSLPGVAAAEISVPAPQLSAGRYVLSWRAMSGDGHLMPGKVTFTVKP